jgi:hypothetical protein
LVVVVVVVVMAVVGGRGGRGGHGGHGGLFFMASGLSWDHDDVLPIGVSFESNF